MIRDDRFPTGSEFLQTISSRQRDINTQLTTKNISFVELLSKSMSAINSSFRLLQYASFKTLFAFLLLIVPAIGLFYLAL